MYACICLAMTKYIYTTALPTDLGINAECIWFVLWMCKYVKVCVYKAYLGASGFGSGSGIGSS